MRTHLYMSEYGVDQDWPRPQKRLQWMRRRSSAVIILFFTNGGGSFTDASSLLASNILSDASRAATVWTNDRLELFNLIKKYQDIIIRAKIFFWDYDFMSWNSKEIHANVSLQLVLQIRPPEIKDSKHIQEMIKQVTNYCISIQNLVLIADIQMSVIIVGLLGPQKALPFPPL